MNQTNIEMFMYLIIVNKSRLPVKYMIDGMIVATSDTQDTI